MRIRGAMIEDAAGIARVQVDSYRTAYAGIWPESVLGRLSYGEQEQDWRDWISANPDDVLYVAELDTGEIVGYALARCGPTGVVPYDSELIALHVLVPYQRQGWGRRLVATLAKELRGRGCKSLMVWVLEENRARGFYESPRVVKPRFSGSSAHSSIRASPGVRDSPSGCFERVMAALSLNEHVPKPRSSSPSQASDP